MLKTVEIGEQSLVKHLPSHFKLLHTKANTHNIFGSLYSFISKNEATVKMLTINLMY